ncbi:hypothetical protein Q672_06885 [Marinobacter sp. EVN1]|uniref:hypothetical protein n=1 Tax=Marinobacter sp. EVN1 TaxID=1397532 RepID=UPI0003B834BA|nr:hypothetical protein [Marinobacter sp. EVN1]ERS81032.1 hypothetical protein Q672_06885 [Marinobacter sp. EVN1]
MAHLNRLEDALLLNAQRMIFVLVLSVGVFPASSLATIRLELTNDIILSSDNQFTNGTSVVVSSPVADSLNETPSEIERSELIVNDVPYVGFLGWGNSFYGFNDDTFYGAHLSLWLSTDTVDEDNLPASEDPRNSFGSFMAEYRF